MYILKAYNMQHVYIFTPALGSNAFDATIVSESSGLTSFLLKLLI